MSGRLPRLSVAICTYNRQHDLQKGLAGLLAQAGWLDGDEVIVVDNNSSDGTREVVADAEQAAAALGVPVRYVLEPRPGVSFARNTAYEKARNPVVAYLDDDAVPLPGWLRGIRAPFADPAVGAVGGPIRPAFEVPPPAWYGSGFSVRDVGREGPLQGLSAWLGFPGGNMAIRRELLGEVRGFDTGLGPKGSVMAFGEETDFFVRLHRSQGNVTFFAPAAAIAHREPAAKQELRYVARRTFDIAKEFPAQAVTAYGAPRGIALALAKALKQSVTGLGYGVRSVAGKRFAFQAVRRLLTAAGVLWGTAQVGLRKGRRSS